MTLPDVHLAEEALAAYVDGVLSPAAAERAERHLRSCAECRTAAEAEREAKVLVAAAPDPELPAGLLARLLEVPMTADLGGPPDLVLAVDHGELGWAASGRSARPVEPRVVERSRTTGPATGTGAGRRPSGAARPAGPAGAGAPSRRGSVVRPRRGRRGLAVSLAGLAFGVLASAASTGGTGTAAPARPGSAPGQVPAQLVVGPSARASMEAGTIRFDRPTPERASLVATRSPAR